MAEGQPRVAFAPKPAERTIAGDSRQTMIPDSKLVDYYTRRAGEYERIYAKPERQSDLAALRARLRDLLAGRAVLEVACGTGYWTQVIGDSAQSILATDINDEVLEIARHKDYPRVNVRFQKADAFTLAEVGGAFSAGFAGFWWSHIPLDRIPAFLNRFHEKLNPEAKVVFLDNNYVEGSSTPLSRRDSCGNTYQRRSLDNGTACEALKNFPAESELVDAVEKAAARLEVVQFKYYWLFSYDLKTE